MVNFIPLIGWVTDLFFKSSLAFPFWMIWTVFGLGETYFYFLPPVYQSPSFWACLGVFITIPILKGILIPKIMTVTQTNTGPK